MAKGFTFVGSDAARAKALSRKPRAPKFALGAVVMDVYGDIAAIDGIYADLRAAEDAGIVEDAAAWLAEQEKKPKTPVTGIWYTLVFGHGAGLAGEKDLKLAPPGSKSNPGT
jgi:hypothetical protein